MRNGDKDVDDLCLLIGTTANPVASSHSVRTGYASAIPLNRGCRLTRRVAAGCVCALPWDVDLHAATTDALLRTERVYGVDRARHFRPGAVAVAARPRVPSPPLPCCQAGELARAVARKPPPSGGS